MTKAEQYQAIIGAMPWKADGNSSKNIIVVLESLAVKIFDWEVDTDTGLQFHFNDKSWLIVIYRVSQKGIDVVGTMAGPQDTEKNLREAGR